ncbi:MAG: cytochrome P450 [Alphaproteobacteria bacterium]|nr:cytochrome P450 [Alphaproteobacteria bacterium]MCB9794805.1 cytochrome P450 [Alphaproteobacteria bacterium]
MSAPLQLPPCLPQGAPIVGNTLAFLRHPGEFFAQTSATLGPVFRAHLLGKPTLCFVGPEAVRFVLVTNNADFETGRGWPRGLRMLMEGALMMKGGEEHKRTRRLLAPAFVPSALDRLVPVLEGEITRHMDAWQTMVSVEAHGALKELTFDIASVLFLGREQDSERPYLSKLFKTYTHGMEWLHPVVPIDHHLTPFGKAMDARRELLTYVEAALRSRIDAQRDGDPLSLMIQGDLDVAGEVDISALAGQALFLLFAGHESTTTLITMSLVELSEDLALQELLRQEVTGLGEPVTVNALEALPLLQRVLLETERLYPPFTGGFRQVVRDTEFNGYAIPSGWQAFFGLAGTHHLDSEYAAPWKYDVSRWQHKDEAQMRRRCALAGFGGGAHRCIGHGLARLESALVIARVLQRFRLALPDDHKLSLRYTPSIRPRQEIRLLLCPLESPS